MSTKPFYSFLMLGFTVLFTVVGQLLVKKGMVMVGPAATGGRGVFDLVLRAFTNLYVLGGLASALFAAVCWLFALSKMPLSYAYPFVAFTFVLVPVGAWLFFGENVPPARWLGIAFIILGVWLSYK